MMKRPYFRYLIIVLIITVLVSALPGVRAEEPINSTVRIWLNRLKLQDTLRIEVKGNYMLADGSMLFADGAQFAVALRGDQLVLHTDHVALTMGSGFVLRRCESDVSSALKLNGNDGLYEGDLHLSIYEGEIRAVLHAFVEDYLLGVVPYEMGDSFPLEALKAQAIAARTYALQRTGSGADYDVEDTTNDQAYKGRSAYHPISEQAVRETEGMCGTYKGKLADCYYSASNGGQTELGEHVWPSEDPDKYGYMDMRDDPFDLENDASSVKRFTLKKKPGKEGVGEALHSVLVHALASELERCSYQADEQLVRIDEILSAELLTPKFNTPSRLMTELRLRLKVSCRQYAYKDEREPSSAASLVHPYAAVTPSPTATPRFSPYKAIPDVLEVTLPIFGDVEKAMGLSINVYQNELITLHDIGSAYMFESRRYGHGVGMSQRGAQQMASKYAMNHRQILSFYYPGMEIRQYHYQPVLLASVDYELMATPAPTPSPTPRPTLMPVTADNLPRGAYVAVVSNIGDDSSLNLRQAPSLSSDVLRRLYKNQQLIVLKTYSDGWSRVKTDVIEGYVRSEYLQTAQEINEK